jgi:uncharacterized membrane protein AbrB (regulator of aidB expression)
MARRLTTRLAAPSLYISWAVFVVIALVVAYSSDPYVFGFAAIGLAWLIGTISVVGVSAILLTQPAPHARVLVVTALLVAVIAIAVAFGVLRTFSWA